MQRGAAEASAGQRAAALLTAGLDSLPDLLVLVGLDGKVVEVLGGRATRDPVLGRNLDDGTWIGADVADLVRPAFRATVADIVRNAPNGPVTADVRLDSGGCYEIAGAPVAVDEVPAGVRLVIRDVTADRAARDALAAAPGAQQEYQTALRLFTTAVEEAPIGMCLVGLDGTFLRVNAAMCRLLERAPAELLQSAFQDLTHPEDLEADLTLVQECLAGDRDRFALPKRYLTPSGRVIHAYLSVSLIRDEQGRPEHFVSQIVDLTAAYEAEQRIWVLEDRNRIARELHDHVVQRIFAVGLSLQALASTQPVDTVRTRLEDLTAEIDLTIKEIRQTIYGIRGPGQGSGTAVRDRIVAVVDELTPKLPSRPRLVLNGPLEVAVAGDIVDQLLAALRESLTTLADGGDADRIEIEIDVDLPNRHIRMAVRPQAHGGLPGQRAGDAPLSSVAWTASLT
jgi:PAS domain S-box-containing protein